MSEQFQRYVDDVFSLPDGSRIFLSWPMPVKPEDRQLVEDWLKLMMGKMLREPRTSGAGTTGGGE